MIVRLAIVAVVVGMLAAAIGRGRFRNLLGLQVRWSALLGVFVVATLVAQRGVAGAFGLTLVGLGAFVVFAVRNALPVRGMLAVAVGFALNFVVTANNGGMPYRPSAVVAAGAVRSPARSTSPSTSSSDSSVASDSADLVPRSDATTHPQRSSDQMVFLSKIIAVRPLRDVVSVGDVLAAVGIGLVVFHAMLGDGRRRPRHGAAPNSTVRIGRSPVGSEAAGTKAKAAADQVAIGEDVSPWCPPLDDVEARDNGAPSAERTAVTACVHDPLLERARLLKATGDITVVLDLVPGRDVLAEALRSESGLTGHAAVDDARTPGDVELAAQLAVSRALARVGGPTEGQSVEMSLVSTSRVVSE